MGLLSQNTNGCATAVAFPSDFTARCSTKHKHKTQTQNTNTKHKHKTKTQNTNTKHKHKTQTQNKNTNHKHKTQTQTQNTNGCATAVAFPSDFTARGSSR